MASLPQGINVTQGNFYALSKKVKDFIAEKSELCQPDSLHICDGSEKEAKQLSELLVESGTAEKLHNMDNWYAQFLFS